MNSKQIREKFKSGSWLKKLIGSKTYAAVQEVTEYILNRLENHDYDITDLEGRICDLESDIRRLEDSTH